MPTSEDQYYDDRAQALDDNAAMIDAVQNRGVDGSFPMDYDCELDEEV